MVGLAVLKYTYYIVLKRNAAHWLTKHFQPYVFGRAFFTILIKVCNSIKYNCWNDGGGGGQICSRLPTIFKNKQTDDPRVWPDSYKTFYIHVLIEIY